MKMKDSKSNCRYHYICYSFEVNLPFIENKKYPIKAKEIACYIYSNQRPSSTGSNVQLLPPVSVWSGRCTRVVKYGTEVEKPFKAGNIKIFLITIFLRHGKYKAIKLQSVDNIRDLESIYCFISASAYLVALSGFCREALNPFSRRFIFSVLSNGFPASGVVFISSAMNNFSLSYLVACAIPWYLVITTIICHYPHCQWILPKFKQIYSTNHIHYVAHISHVTILSVPQLTLIPVIKPYLLNASK